MCTACRIQAIIGPRQIAIVYFRSTDTATTPVTARTSCHISRDTNTTRSLHSRKLVFVSSDVGKHTEVLGRVTPALSTFVGFSLRAMLERFVAISNVIEEVLIVHQFGWKQNGCHEGNLQFDPSLQRERPQYCGLERLPIAKNT